MSFTYAVVGAGRQGVAAAYDLAVRGDASRILFLDLSDAAASAAAERVNTLAGRRLAEGREADASDARAMASHLAGTQAILSAAHYNVNLGLTRVASSIGAHMVDLGGHTGIVREQHGRDESAFVAVPPPGPCAWWRAVRGVRTRWPPAWRRCRPRSRSWWCTTPRARSCPRR